MNTIRTVFQLYGFEPLETPAFENLETLMGKYGEEGDKLMFKILNNGLDNPEKLETTKTEFQKIISGKSSKAITERALRYDLTIPFARYVAMNAGKLTLPYKRYQIQPVWRADRPQKGRYREFYQCDADIVGSYSLLNDAELAHLYQDVFNKLKLDVEIKINSRKILSALANVCGGPDKMNAITVSIDKLDKIGLEKVKVELEQRGLGPAQIDKISSYLNISGSNEEKLKQVSEILGNEDEGRKGIEELKTILGYANDLVIDLTLARGLNYYTGTIYEVKAKNVEIGSIGGGGRYDDLTGLFGVPNIPGVGISFGVDRIYDVMDELNLFPENVGRSAEVLFFNMGAEEVKAAFKEAQKLRSAGIACDIYHEPGKMDKQFKYAGKKNISYAVMIGSRELSEGNCIVKELATGNQETVALNDLADHFKKKVNK